MFAFEVLGMEAYTCPVHGHNDIACHENWTSGCYQATYGFACAACGYVEYNIPQSSDEAHGALCCGTPICSTEGDGSIHSCVTHGTYF